MQFQTTAFFPNFNLQILSSKSNLRSSFTNLFNFKFSKTCWKIPKWYKRSLTSFSKNEFGALILSVLKKKVFCLVKWAKTNAFSSISKTKTDKTAKFFPTYRILIFSKFDSLDPTYQTSKKRELDRLEKSLWNIKSFISPESSRTRCKLKLVLKFRVSMM